MTLKSPTKPFLKFFIMQSKAVGLEEIPHVDKRSNLPGRVLHRGKPNLLDVSSRVSQQKNNW